MSRNTKIPFNGSAANRPSPSELSFAGALVRSFDGSHHVPALDPVLRANADIGGLPIAEHNGNMA